jgi:hypothetical protein
MARLLRPIAGLLLSLVLILSSGVMAVARGQVMTQRGEVVLCTGQGLVTVALDDRGEPVGPAHICPDCALSVFATFAMHAPGLPQPAFRLLAVLAPARAPAPASLPAPQPAARGPPPSA